MVVNHQYVVGDIVRLKKTHPCGMDQWQVLRTGIDFRVKCQGCNHIVWLSRKKFEKAVKDIIYKADSTWSITHD